MIPISVVAYSACFRHSLISVGVFSCHKRSTRLKTATLILLFFLALTQGGYYLIFGGKQSGSRDSSGSLCSSLLPTWASSKKTTASFLWREHEADLLSASQHPDDPGYSHEAWTKVLFSSLPPSALLNTVVPRSRPKPESIRRILRIVQKRLNDPESNPPVKIAVLGGSIAEGNGCDVASVRPPHGSIMANPIYCAWPYRLESFLNSLSGQHVDVVKVINMAEEGTSTGCKAPLLKYWMYPKELLPEGPDVIINAYEAGDALPFEHEGETLADAVRREMKSFARSAERARPCGDPPVVIYMDDTSILRGIEGGLFGKTNKRNRHVDAETKQEEQLPQLMLIDHSEAVRVVSHSDQLQQEAAAVGREKKQSGMEETRKVASATFGMAGHVATMWVLSYNLVDALLGYCSEERGQARLFQKLDEEAVDAEPWHRCQESNPCVVSWLAGPAGTVSNAREISDYIDPFLMENDGWIAETDMSTGWSRKAGLMASGLGASMIVEVRDLVRPVRVLNLVSIKSYGERWRDSLARFTVSVVGAVTNQGAEGLGDRVRDQLQIKWETSFEVSGTHQSATHITFPYEVDIGEEHMAQPGETLRVTIELIGGETFKILGMMFCSR